MTWSHNELLVSRSIHTKVIDKDLILNSETRMWYWYPGNPKKMADTGDLKKIILSMLIFHYLLIVYKVLCLPDNIHTYIRTHLCIHTRIHMHTHIFFSFPTNDLLKWLYGFIEFSRIPFICHTSVWNLEYDCLWIHYFKAFYNFYVT